MNKISSYFVAVICTLFLFACGGNGQGNDSNDPHNSSEETVIKDADFYQGLLEAFCQEHFDKKFKGTKYIEGSLSVRTISPEDDHTVLVIGDHDYQYLYGTFGANDKEFRAYIKDLGNGQYHIKFDRQGAINKNETKTTGNVPFIYDANE